MIIILFVVLIYALTSFAFGHITSGSDSKFIAARKPPLIIAHGGSKQLFPENTMPAFDGVVPFHPDVLEMDVVLTRDSVLITHHDPTINRLSNGKGKVADYTLDEIRQFNFGYHFKDLNGNYPYRDSLVPPAVLDDVLGKYGRQFLFCIEIKDYSPSLGQSAARMLLKLLKKHNMEKRTMVACFDDGILNYFRKISEYKIPTSSAKRQTKRFVILQLFFAGNFFTGKCDALQIPVEREGFRMDKKSLIRAAHRKNMAVHYWTINDESEMRQLLLLGADGIITDRVDIADRIFREMGYRE
jgi:glycerophosphoryl diester phosphodiesterase